MDVGQRIRQHRLERGWSQTALAEMCGSHQTNVSQWELGQLQPSLRSLLNVAAALGVEPARLLGD